MSASSLPADSPNPPNPPNSSSFSFLSSPSKGKRTPRRSIFKSPTGDFGGTLKGSFFNSLLAAGNAAVSGASPRAIGAGVSGGSAGTSSGNQHDNEKLAINTANADGTTALIAAAKSGRVATVRLLLESFKADPAIKDKEDKTALDHAIAEKHLGVVVLLSTYAERLRGPERSDKYLAGALSRSSSGSSSGSAAADSEINMAIDEERGTTALMAAAKGGKVDTVKLLLTAFGADPCIEDKSGRIALDVAVEAKCAPVVSILAAAMERQALQKSGASSPLLKAYIKKLDVDRMAGPQSLVRPSFDWVQEMRTQEAAEEKALLQLPELVLDETLRLVVAPPLPMEFAGTGRAIVTEDKNVGASLLRSVFLLFLVSFTSPGVVMDWLVAYVAEVKDRQEPLMQSIELTCLWLLRYPSDHVEHGSQLDVIEQILHELKERNSRESITDGSNLEGSNRAHALRVGVCQRNFQTGRSVVRNLQERQARKGEKKEGSIHSFQKKQPAAEALERARGPRQHLGQRRDGQPLLPEGG